MEEVQRIAGWQDYQGTENASVGGEERKEEVEIDRLKTRRETRADRMTHASNIEPNVTRTCVRIRKGSRNARKVAAEKIRETEGEERGETRYTCQETHTRERFYAIAETSIDS